jgi:PAS domain S-box-containing protein
MKQIDYNRIIAESSYGYVYHRLILDDNGRPYDYLYIEVNRAFEEMTGVKGESIIGKKGTDVSPFNIDEISQRIQLYGNSVLNNQKIVMEQYSEYLHKWFKVEISPQQDLFFITIFSDITELKENRDKFEQYVKYSPYGIYVTDSTGKIILVNPVLCRSIGYTEDELLNKSVIDMLTQSTRADGMDGIKTLLETDNDSRDMLIEKKSGEQIWVALKTAKLPDGSYMGFLRDISDRKNAEKELEEFALFNKTLLDTIPVPVFYKDTGGRFLGINRAFSGFSGITADTIESKTVSEIIPAEMAEVYNKKDKELFSNPGIQIYEQSINYNNKELRDVIFHKATFNNIKGQVGGIIGAIVDITDLKKTHRDLELYFRAIQSVDQPILITDSRGNIISVKNAFIKMYGFDLE